MTMTSAEGCWVWARVRKWLSKLCQDGCPWFLRQARLCLREVFNLLSFEFLVRRENGGGVVFVRAFIVASLLFAFSLFLYSWLDPSRTVFSWTETRTLAAERLEWFGVLWGGAYVALYTRFASQWSYLANMFNAIKAAEVAGATSESARDESGQARELSEKQRSLLAWRVSFIVDADALHLLCKDPYPETIAGWLVYHPGLIEMYEKLNTDLDAVVERIGPHLKHDDLEELKKKIRAVRKPEEPKPTDPDGYAPLSAGHDEAPGKMPVPERETEPS